MLNVKKRCPDFTKLSVHVTLGQPPLAALQIVMYFPVDYVTAHIQPTLCPNKIVHLLFYE